MIFILYSITSYLILRTCGNDPMKKELRLLADRCAEQQVTVTHICVDNCCESRASIRSVKGLEDIVVCQDIKHLVNRILKHYAKRHPLWADFSAKTGGKSIRWVNAVICVESC